MAAEMESTSANENQQENKIEEPLEKKKKSLETSDGESGMNSFYTLVVT